MNIQQSNRETMASAVSDTLNAYNSTWTTNVLFGEQVTQHGKNLDDVRKWRDKQAEQAMIKGLTRDKKILREITVAEAIMIIAAIKTLANATEDYALYESVNFSESRLLKERENTFIADCMQVHSVATANSAELVAYGVTAGMITVLGTDIASYQDIHSKTRSKRVVVKGYTKNLKESVKVMMDFLKNILDLSIKQYTESVPDFVNDYTNARIIVNYGNTHTGLRGIITNDETGQKLAGIQVTIVELGMNAYSSKRGVYTFGSIPYGKYTLRMHGVGYTTTEIPDVQLHEGKLTDFDIQLMAADAPVPVPVNN